MCSKDILQYLTKQLKSNIPNTFPFGIKELLFILDIWLTKNAEKCQLTIIRTINDKIFIGIGKNLITDNKTVNENIPTFVNIPFGLNQQIQQYQSDLTITITQNKIELFTGFLDKTLLEILKLDINYILNYDFSSLDNNFLSFNNLYLTPINSNICYSPTYNEFINCMNNAFIALNNNILKKIVLSRTIHFNVDSYDLGKLIIFLLKQELYSKKCVNFFYLSLNNRELFISFTPESLLRIDNNNLYTEALAGSSPIIKDKYLSQDEKNLNENTVVVDYIKNKLSSLNIVPNIHKTQIKELNYITHLITPITANLPEYNHYTILEIINSLHPTPATLGVPSNNSFEFIQKFNNYPKYQYASSSGVIFKNNAHMLVLLRSALIKSSEITLFGGAGIMPSSDIIKEWDEMGIKMSAIIEKLPFVNKDMLYKMLREK